MRLAGSGWVDSHWGERPPLAAIMFCHRSTAWAGLKPASAISQLGGAGAQAAFLLPGSRTQESEADIVGQRLMAEAGFNPAQAVDLWQNMMAASGGRSPQWLSTHPDPANRIRELQRDAPSLSGVYQQAQADGRRPKCG